jgi:MFS family permease
MFVMIIIMMPLATTEIGTDGWITSIMTAPLQKEGFHGGWVLVYTSAIMMILRFFAGPIIHKLSPLGLLAVSAVLAIGGLTLLSGATGLAMIFGAATLYGFGKTFFWPTMLGVVSDQTPRGGALTLNALGGIGMLAVGTLGSTFIGALQADKKIDAIAAAPAAKEVPGLVAGDTLNDKVLERKSKYEIIHYKNLDDKALANEMKDLPKEKQEQITKAGDSSKQKALMNMAMFPGFMLVMYLILIAYFKSRGGYRPVEIHTDEQVKKPGLPAADEF